MGRWPSSWGLMGTGLALSLLTCWRDFRRQLPFGMLSLEGPSVPPRDTQLHYHPRFAAGCVWSHSWWRNGGLGLSLSELLISFILLHFFHLLIHFPPNLDRYLLNTLGKASVHPAIRVYTLVSGDRVPAL